MKKLGLFFLLILIAPQTHPVKLPKFSRGSIITTIALCTVYGIYQWFKPRNTALSLADLYEQVRPLAPHQATKVPDYYVTICIPHHGFEIKCSQEPALAKELTKRGLRTKTDELFIPISSIGGEPCDFPAKLPLKLLIGQEEGRIVTFPLDKKIVGIQLCQYKKEPQETITFQRALETVCTNSNLKIEYSR